MSRDVSTHLAACKRTNILPGFSFEQIRWINSQSTLFLSSPLLPSFPAPSLSSLLRGWGSTAWWAPTGSVSYSIQVWGTLEKPSSSPSSPQSRKLRLREAKGLAQGHGEVCRRAAENPSLLTPGSEFVLINQAFGSQMLLLVMSKGPSSGTREICSAGGESAPGPSSEDGGRVAWGVETGRRRKETG